MCQYKCKSAWLIPLPEGDAHFVPALNVQTTPVKPEPEHREVGMKRVQSLPIDIHKH